MFLYHVLFLRLKMNIMHKDMAPRKTHQSYIKYVDVYLLNPSPYINYEKLFYGSANYSNLK